MKLDGEATVQRGIDEVYAALTDPAVLVRTIPGCQRLEQVDDDSFKATVVAGVASIKGTFDGQVRLTDRQAPHSFTLHASGAGAPGTVTAVARVSLTATDAGTLVRYDADATIGGVIGGVGQRMITGVAKRTAADFFADVNRVLTGDAVVDKAADIPTPETTPEIVPARVDGPTVWTAPPAVVDPARLRVRDLVAGAAFGVVVTLLGVIVGAIVVRW